MVVREGSKGATTVGGVIALSVVGGLIVLAFVFYLYGRTVFQEALEESPLARAPERSKHGPA